MGEVGPDGMAAIPLVEVAAPVAGAGSAEGSGRLEVRAVMAVSLALASRAALVSAGASIDDYGCGGFEVPPLVGDLSAVQAVVRNPSGCRSGIHFVPSPHDVWCACAEPTGPSRRVALQLSRGRRRDEVWDICGVRSRKRAQRETKSCSCLRCAWPGFRGVVCSLEV